MIIMYYMHMYGRGDYALHVTAIAAVLRMCCMPWQCPSRPPCMVLHVAS